MFVPNYLKNLISNTRGTSIYFQFHEGIQPKNLNNIVLVGEGPNREMKNWMAFLSVKTALGCVENIRNIPLKIKLHLDKSVLINHSQDFNKPAYI